jgi:hypothetical protein
MEGEAMAKGEAVSKTPWDPKEAGRIANQQDQDEARLKQERAQAERANLNQERIRKQRGPSIVGPALQRIKRCAQQNCAEFNSQIQPPGRQAKIVDNNGFGVDGIPHTFSIVRGDRRVTFSADYDHWILLFRISGEPERRYELIEHPNEDRVTLKGRGENLTEEEIALEGCKIVCSVTSDSPHFEL